MLGLGETDEQVYATLKGENRIENYLKKVRAVLFSF